MLKRPQQPRAGQKPIRLNLEEIGRATEARDMAKAQKTPAAKAILNIKGAVERGNRSQQMEGQEAKLINRTGTGYGSYRNK